MATTDGPWPYHRKDWLLSRTEYSFFHVLRQSLPPAFHICPKVRLGDALYVGKGAGKDFRSWRNRIDRNHLDFLIGDERMRPVLAVELDDTSHQRSSTQKRDEVKDKALSAADLPIWRVKARRSYNPAELTAEFESLRLK